MTVSVQNPRTNVLVGNGVTTQFSFDFKVWATTDVKVYVDNVLKTITTDYTAALTSGGTAGGVVTFLAAPANNSKIVIVRAVPLARTIDYQQQGAFIAAEVNTDHDKEWAKLQEHNDALGRVVALNESDASATLILPIATARANKVIAFDGSGNVIVSTKTVDEFESAVFLADAAAAAAGASASDSATSAAAAASSETASSTSATASANSATAAAASAVQAASTVGNAIVAQYSGTGAQTAYTLSVDPIHENNIVVTVNGVTQHHDTYSVSGTTLTFSAAPPSGTNIEVIIRQTLPIGVPSDNTISTIKLVDGSITNVKINDVAWGKLTGVPTTVSGYGITDAVTLTGSETLTNKTINASNFNAGSVTSSTIGTTNTVTLTDVNFTLKDEVDNTKQAVFQVSGLTTGTTRTFALPDASTTLVGTDATQTLTNKTLSGVTVLPGSGQIDASGNAFLGGNTSHNARLSVKSSGSDQHIVLEQENATTDGWGIRSYGFTGGFFEISRMTPATTFTPKFAINTDGTTYLGGAINSESIRVIPVTNQVNRFDIYGNGSGSFPELWANGSDTHIGIQYRTKGNQSHYFSTNVSDRQVAVVHTAGATRYLTLTGGAGASLATVSTNDSALHLDSANSQISLLSGTGSAYLYQESGDFVVQNQSATNIKFKTNAGSTQFSINNTTNAVNYVAFTGQTAGNSPYLFTAGSSTDIGFDVVCKGASNTRFFSAGGGSTNFIISHTANAVNNWWVSGSSTGSAPIFQTSGSDTNVSASFITKGTGVYYFQTGNAGNNQFVVGHTASAVNYLQVTGGAAGTQPSIYGYGNDPNVGLQFWTKGEGAFSFRTGGSLYTQFTVTNTTNAVDYVNVTGGTGSVSIGTSGTSTNVHVYHTSKGNSNHQFGHYNSPGTASLRLGPGVGSAVATNGITLVGAASGTGPQIIAQDLGGTGNANIPLNIAASGTSAIYFCTNGGATVNAVVAHATNAVNYPALTGGATGDAVTLSVDGSDTNAGVRVLTKGTGTLTLGSATSTLGFFASGASAKQTISGSRGGNAALASLITALANYGLITDGTTA